MTIDELRRELTLANHILAREGLLAGLGHISARHPDRPDRFFLSRALAPNLVTMSDLHEFDLDGNLTDGSNVNGYAERVIHAAVYAARPDVMSVCHNHAIEILPFCNVGRPPGPVTHIAGMMGETVPVWDNRVEFGDTQIIVIRMEEAVSMARALGPNRCMLLRRHGALVVGKTIRETVFRSIVLRDNARVHLDAIRLGEPSTLTPKEMEISNALHESPRIVERVWDGWVAELGPGIADKLR
jgi:HCOMODA/2-hydroxy-3-carboxy-muconic semialdehyde decarboxylase